MPCCPSDLPAPATIARGPASAKKSTGLGLSFVKEIAELHHGRATLKNQPGGGAVATLSLPRREGAG